MSKKLTNNGLWESSRMMLPQHREAHILREKTAGKKERPQIDEQEADRLSRIIAESMLYGQEVTLLVFGQFNETELKGIVTKIDQQRKKIRLIQGHDVFWVSITDIIGAQLQFRDF
ncbi:YolD-like protein [compost metagenome]